MDRGLPETERLRRNVEWALQRALDPATVLPMLHRLSRLAAEGSDESVYAQRRLAELLVDHHPWRAALAAKRVLAVQPSDDGAWAILALCHALLGNNRCAVAAYGQALQLAPKNAVYAHNLGHLVDVALDRPREALTWLRSAYALTNRRVDIAVSLAHALGRAGEIAEALRVSERALKAKDSSCVREHVAIAEWLAAGAHDEPKILRHRPPAPVTGTAWTTARSPGRLRTRARDGRTLDEILSKGLASLPLSREQRSRARALARDPSLDGARLADVPTRTSVAAAVAYAIVFIEEIPLTQTEVAACFRVSVPALRSQWKALRGRIQLTARGGRVATERPR